MILSSIARGVEHEYAMNTYPPDRIPRRTVIHSALNTLRAQGLVSSVGWSSEDEVGNPEYERTLLKQWSLQDGPYPVAYNGMRVYDDAIHFEVGSPVYRDPLDGIAFPHVGEIFTHRACRALTAQIELPVLAYKNNLSTRPTADGFESVAYGTHFNLMLHRRDGDADRWSTLRQALLSYYVARILLCGAGDMLPVSLGKHGPSVTFDDGTLKAREVHFAVSPRVAFLRRTTSFDTTVDRGMVNTRDEPFADPHRYWRYHDINFEALRCPLQLFVRDVLQTFVYAAFQAGLLEDAPRVRNPLAAALRLSVDVEDMRWRVDLEDGSRVDAAKDLLVGYYLERVDKLVQREGSADDRRAFQVLSWVAKKVANRDLEPLMWGLDWVTKQRLLREYEVAGAEAVALCNQYSFIDATVNHYLGDSPGEECDSLFEPDLAFEVAAKHLAWVDWANWKDRIGYRLMHGPLDTRDYCRSALLKRFEGEIAKASWDRLYLRDGDALIFGDPLRFTREECGQAVESAGSLATFRQKVVA